MALLSASYIIIFPFIMFFTIPLAVLAGVTTTISFAILMFRLLFVYFQLFMSLLPSWLSWSRRSRHIPYGAAWFPRSSPSSMVSSSPSGGSAPTFAGPGPLTHRSLSLNRIPQRRRPRSRRMSSTSAAPDRDASTPSLASESGGGGGGGNMGLIPSIGIGRDFEGIGGWRLGCEDDADDDRWAMINSRLEFFDRPHHGARHHRRASSGGTEGGLMMKGGRHRARSRRPPHSPASIRSVVRVSPNSSRVRVSDRVSDMPPTEDDGEYFPL